MKQKSSLAVWKAVQICKKGVEIKKGVKKVSKKIDIEIGISGGL